MNRSMRMAVGILFSISAVFAVEWVKESSAFEFPGTAVKQRTLTAKSLNFSTRQLPGKRLLIRYNLPVSLDNAVVNIYSTNGARVTSIALDNRKNAVTWNASHKGAGAYIAEIKAENVKKSVRFVIAN